MRRVDIAPIVLITLIMQAEPSTLPPALTPKPLVLAHFARQGSAHGSCIVSGHVRVIRRTGVPLTQVYVYAEPISEQSTPAPGHYRIVQKDKRFIPALVVIPAGSRVDFPNLDIIFHNVFSLTRPHAFDLGLYRAGASKSHVFTDSGTYSIFCNIHPQMFAEVVAVRTDFITKANVAGNYSFSVPSGAYRITALSERSQPEHATVACNSNVSAPQLVLDESHWVATPHKNKYGNDYSSLEYDPLSHQ
jgi:plastocyanin